MCGVERNVATGFTPNSAAFFELVLGHTLEGTFGDPHYGGNRDFSGWELLGYPSLRLAVTPELQRMDARPEMTRLSAYHLPMFAADEGGHGDEHGPTLTAQALAWRTAERLAKSWSTIAA